MATRAERTNDKILLKKHTQILVELLKEPGNKFCADCHKKGAY